MSDGDVDTASHESEHEAVERPNCQRPAFRFLDQGSPGIPERGGEREGCERWVTRWRALDADPLLYTLSGDDAADALKIDKSGTDNHG